MLEARRASQIDFAPDGTPIVVGNSNAGGLPLFSIIQVPLNSERLGFLSLTKDNGLLSGDVFVDAYNELVKLSLTGNEPSIITMAQYEAEILAKGKCGKFGLSTTNKQFKIPFIPGLYLQGKESSADTGTWTPDQMQGHFHTLVGVNWNSGLPIMGAGGTGSTGVSLSGARSVEFQAQQMISDGVNGTPRISSKTKPESIYVDYQMKLYGTLTNKTQVDMANVTNQLVSKLDTVTYQNDASLRLRAWCYCNSLGSIQKSKGIASVTRLSTGNYRITLLQAAPDTNYIVLTGCSGNGFVVSYNAASSSYPKTPLSFVIRTMNYAGTDTDTEFSVAITY